MDKEAELEKIRTVEREIMDLHAQKDINGAMLHYAPKVEMRLSGGRCADDWEGVRNLYQNSADDPNSGTIGFKEERSYIADSGDLAYTTGSFGVGSTDPATGERVTTRGSNLSVWQKQADGSWKIVADYTIFQP